VLLKGRAERTLLGTKNHLGVDVDGSAFILLRDIFFKAHQIKKDADQKNEIDQNEKDGVDEVGARQVRQHFKNRLKHVLKLFPKFFPFNVFGHRSQHYNERPYNFYG
jgi:hypothetical protein